MKKNLLSIIILALIVVNIVLSAIMMVSVSSASKKTAALVGDISALIGIEINGVAPSQAVSSVSMADTGVYTIKNGAEDLTIPLKTGEDGKTHYAVGSVSLSLNKTHEDYATYGSDEAMASRTGLITDIIYSVFAKYTMEEAQANSAQIKAEILKGVQELYGSDFIFGVSFSFLYS